MVLSVGTGTLESCTVCRGVYHRRGREGSVVLRHPAWCADRVKERLGRQGGEERPVKEAGRLERGWGERD